MLTKNDISQLQKQGKDITRIEAQIEFFKNGFPYMKLDRPALAGDGIMRLEPAEVRKFSELYENSLDSKKVLKFVPASGAASRMFRDLFNFLKTYKGTEEDYTDLVRDKGPDSVYHVLRNIGEFAFYNELKNLMKKKGIQIEEIIQRRNYHLLADYILTEKGLNYGNLPKALIKFHIYGKVARTPVEEHLVEGAEYARYNDGQVNVHFTVSSEHEERFRNHVDLITSCYENHLEVQYSIAFSQQKPSTDTIAVNLGNEPFRNGNGTILFRPAGHGALLENLAELDADIIFIKNIDNVVSDRLKEPTILYKKVIAGVLLHYQDKIFRYLELLENEETPAPSVMNEIKLFVEKELCVNLPDKNEVNARNYFINKLNRPIRVCGMVKNEGEPGGGPFWTYNRDGSVSLQIVESAQADMDDRAQKKIFDDSTHFNPVDLVCGIYDRHGEKFDLSKYVDPFTGFISKKSQGGKDLKALELPGLWNGSMADWNTIFVEVPIETFSPVKTVNDLLRDQHR